MLRLAPPPNYLQYTQLLNFKIQLFSCMIFFLEEIRRCDFLNPSTFPQSNFQKKAYRFSNELICALLNS